MADRLATYVNLPAADGALVLAIFDSLALVDDFANVNVLGGVRGCCNRLSKCFLVGHCEVESLTLEAHLELKTCLEGLVKS